MVNDKRLMKLREEVGSLRTQRQKEEKRRQEEQKRKQELNQLRKERFNLKHGRSLGLARKFGSGVVSGGSAVGGFIGNFVTPSQELVQKQRRQQKKRLGQPVRQRRELPPLFDVSDLI